MADVMLYDALRTPRGRRRGGAVVDVPALDLVTGLLRSVPRRLPGFDPARADDLVLGIVTPVGEQGADLARTAVLAAGWPVSVPGVQVNRFCASGLEAVAHAAGQVALGSARLVLAGGVESMSRVPLGSDGGAFAAATAAGHADPADPLGLVPQGIAADLIASLDSIDRSAVDRYAAESQRRTAEAIADKRYARSLVPVRDADGRVMLDHDEHPRPGTSVDDLARLPPAFAGLGDDGGFDRVALAAHPEAGRIDHVHTAGNSSGIVDGAALVVVGDRSIGEELGLTPRARIVASAVVGSDPTTMLTGPVPATRRVLERAGLGLDDIDLFEVNEAFAAVVLHWLAATGVPTDRVNVNGGAIALGHPLGATGAMLLGTLLDELERRDLRRGLVTLCVGMGMGIAMIIERA